MKRILGELKKRKVVQVAVVCLVAGWLIMQVAGDVSGTRESRPS